MKRRSIILLIVISLISGMLLSSCSDYNIYRFAYEYDSRPFIARVGSALFRTIQDAINYVIEISSKAVSESFTVYVNEGLELTDGSISVSKDFLGDIGVDFGNSTYTFTNETKIGFDIEGADNASFCNGTMIIQSDNVNMKRVYYLAGNNYYQDNITVIDLRSSNIKDNPEFQAIEIADGCNAVFEDSDVPVDEFGNITEINLEGFLDMGKNSTLTINSGMYYLKSIKKDDGSQLIINGGTIQIPIAIKTAVKDCISDDCLVTVIVIGEDESGHEHVCTFGEEKLVASSCGSTGFTYIECSECGNRKKTSDLSFVPHTLSTEYSYNSKYHWHNCTVCHQAADEKEQHTPGPDGLCTVCGSKVDVSFSTGLGFEIVYVNHELDGVVTREKGEDENTWIFRFENKNADSVPTLLEWSVDSFQNGHVMSASGTDCIVVDTSDFGVYTVKCTFSNKYGIKSVSKSVRSWDWKDSD